MKVKNDKKSLILSEEIEKEASNIYPECQDSKKVDEEISKLYSIENWSDMFYYGKSNLMKKRFLDFISKSEFKNFFEALNYEYGINNYPQDIQKAFNIYKNNANKTTDSLSMYKMYHIYKNEFIKFGLKNRNKVLEKFYLFKCASFSTRQEYQCYTLLFNRFNIMAELKINILYEDIDFDKLKKLLEHLKKYFNYYGINPDDTFLIDAFITGVIKTEKNMAMIILQPLIIKGSLQAIYQIALMLNDKTSIEGMFKLCEKSKYYRAYCDYALFLFKEMNNTQKALEILKEAIQNGIIRANYLYYDIFLNSVDFSKIKDNENFKNELLDLFNILINSICLDDAFCFFEFFYLRKICIKHFNLKDFVDKNFSEYLQSFINILIQNSCSVSTDEEIKRKKDLCNKIYLRSDYFSEFNLSCGAIYYYGIENFLKADLNKSLFKFQISFDNSDSKSYKRFCYSFIAKIKHKLFLQKAKDITQEDVEDSKRILFELYSSSIEKNSMPYLSSSFFYYLYTLYKNKWGNQGDAIMEFICIKRASESKINQPGTGTIISYYRRYKSKNLINNDQVLIDKLKKETKNYSSEGYGEDGTICPICFINKMDTIFYPCKHKFCKPCSEKIIETFKCPICRSLILTQFDTKNFEK